MTLGPLVVKVSYATPSAKDGAHAEYIATRPGTDLSVTPDSLARMVRRDLSDDATYTHYIAERPGVVADGEAHPAFAHFAADGGEDEMLVFEFDAEHRAGQHRLDAPFDFNVFFFHS